MFLGVFFITFFTHMLQKCLIYVLFFFLFFSLQHIYILRFCRVTFLVAKKWGFLWCPLSPGLYSRSLSDKVEEEEQGFQLVRVVVQRGEVCLLSSMCRKLEAKREDGEDGRRGVLSLWLCCAGAKGQGTPERCPLLCLVTPGSGRGCPFCSQWRWGPGTSTHPVCHTTWGRELPERKNRRVSVEILFFADLTFQLFTDGGRMGEKRPWKRHLYTLWHCSVLAFTSDVMITRQPRAWLRLPRLPLCQMCPKTHVWACSPASLPLPFTHTRRLLNIKQIFENGRLVFIRPSCKRQKNTAYKMYLDAEANTIKGTT